MKSMKVEMLEKLLLISVSIGLIPIALGYGFMPEKSMKLLFNISVTEINLTHILRAVMGLYLALVVFWMLGVFKMKYRQAAIYSLVVFMFGLAAGRILSILIDGIPNGLLLFYLALELFFGSIGLLILRKSKTL